VTRPAGSRLLRPLRDAVARRLHGLVQRQVDAALARALPELEQRLADRGEPRVEGPRTRLRIASSARVDAALLGTRSGFITIADEAIVEHDAVLVTASGDVTVGRGAVIGARAVLVGPCWIGPRQVVPAGTVVAGNASDEPAATPDSLPRELAAAIASGMTVVSIGPLPASAIADAVGPAGKLFAVAGDERHLRALRGLRVAGRETVEAIPHEHAAALDEAIPDDVHVDAILVSDPGAGGRVLERTQRLLARCRPAVVGATAPEPRVAAGPPPAPPLTGRPWQRAEPPRRLHDVASMLSIRELALLYWLAREQWSGRGAIVDLGSFVGGSTVAFASGLVARRDGTHGRIVHAYDLFEYVGDVAGDTLARFGWESPIRRPARALFDEAIRGLGGLIEVHQGDLSQQRWTSGPIELLFVDIAKSWELNDHVLREFVPHLLPGSVVVQQDFADEWHPWVVIAMELLADHFEWLDVVPHGSVVYRCRRPVPPGALPPRLREELPPERLIELFDRGTSRLEGELRLVAELGAVQLLADLGRYDDARERLAASLRRGSACTRVTADAGPRVAEWLDAVSP
jgi:predicted O-methyltransferase YrrM